MTTTTVPASGWFTTDVLTAGEPAPASADASSHGSHQSSARIPAHLSFGGVLRSERIKLTSLRSIRLTLLITVLAGLGLSLLMAFLLPFGDDAAADLASGGMMPIRPEEYLLTVAGFAAPFLALILGSLGVLAITSEYSSSMILSTLTAVPRRGMVLAAKALVTSVLAGATALVVLLAGLAGAVAVHPEAAEALATRQVVTGVLGTAMYLVLFTLFAFGVAGILRSTAGGIAVVAGVAFVLPVAFQMLMMSGWAWVPVVSDYVPASLGSIVLRGIGDGAPAIDADGMPGYGVALGALALWAAVTVIPAALSFVRRDAK